MFAFIYNNFDADFANQISMISFKFKFKLYENCFDSKNAEIFFIYKNKNHVINWNSIKNRRIIFSTRFQKKKFKFYEIILQRILCWMIFASSLISLKRRFCLYLKRAIVYDYM